MIESSSVHSNERTRHPVVLLAFQHREIRPISLRFQAMYSKLNQFIAGFCHYSDVSQKNKSLTASSERELGVQTVKPTAPQICFQGQTVSFMELNLFF